MNLHEEHVGLESTTHTKKEATRSKSSRLSKPGSFPVLPGPHIADPVQPSVLQGLGCKKFCYARRLARNPVPKCQRYLAQESKIIETRVDHLYRLHAEPHVVFGDQPKACRILDPELIANVILLFLLRRSLAQLDVFYYQKLCTRSVLP